MGINMFKILVADDEIKIRETIKDYFSAKGIETDLADNGETAVEMAEYTSYDLIILDVMMPALNGIEACREIRKSQSVPILFLSALGEERDVLKGFISGADDYIVKPFPLSVLYEKCVSMIRRCKGLTNDNLLICGNIRLDLNRHKVFSSDEEIFLSGKDYCLLKYLAENKGLVLSREIILNRIWGYDFYGDTRVVDTHIKLIRKALGKNAIQIKTIYNTGYKMEEAEHL